MKIKINDEEKFVNQQEYLELLAETEVIDGLPKRKYEIEVIDMNAEAPLPEPTVEELAAIEADDKFAVRVGSEFEKLDEIFNLTLNNLREKALQGQEEYPNLTEAAMNASVAIYMHAKK